MTFNPDSFEFTKEFDVSSSLIDSVYFNENDKTVVLDVNDELYRYSNVSEGDVSALVRGGTGSLRDGSVGAYYNRTFKTTFGPGEHLGYYEDFDPEQVSVRKDQSVPTTPKGLVDAPTLSVVRGENSRDSVLTVAPGGFVSAPADEPTKEFSLSVFDNTVSGAPVAVSDEPTKEFALTVVEDDAAPVREGVSVTVHFRLEDSDKKYKYKAEASDVYDAIEELNQYMLKVGARGDVVKVVTKFE